MRLLKRLALDKFKNYAHNLTRLNMIYMKELSNDIKYLETLHCASVSLKMSLIKLKIEVLIAVFNLENEMEVMEHKRVLNDY